LGLFFSTKAFSKKIKIDDRDVALTPTSTQAQITAHLRRENGKKIDNVMISLRGTIMYSKQDPPIFMSDF